MQQVDPISALRRGARRAVLAAATAGIVAIGMPAAIIPTAIAEPEPPPNTEVAPPPADPHAPVPAPNPEAVPEAAEADRVADTADGFSYVPPPGWVQSDTSHLEYGSALLSKQTGQPVLPGQPPPVANDTRIVLGRLDQRLYASAESDSAKAASRLGSDMGEFFMPYPGTRGGQETVPLGGGGLTGSASYYEVKFTDPAKPVGQVWSGVIGAPPASPGGAPGERWFVVWLGTANNPVDRGAAQALADSIRPLAPPPAEPGVPGAPEAEPGGQPPGQPPGPPVAPAVPAPPA